LEQRETQAIAHQGLPSVQPQPPRQNQWCLVIPTAWLILAVIMLPALWGWLCEALLRRIWPGGGDRSGRSQSRSGGAVDFQI
jgi:hypothetical protein